MKFKRVNPDDVIFANVNKMIALNLKGNSNVRIHQICDVIRSKMYMTPLKVDATCLEDMPEFAEVFAYDMMTNKIEQGYMMQSEITGMMKFKPTKFNYIAGSFDVVNEFRADLFMGLVLDEVYYLKEKQESDPETAGTKMDLELVETKNCWHLCADATTVEDPEGEREGFVEYLRNSAMQGLTPIWTFPKLVGRDLTYYGATNAKFSGMQTHIMDYGFNFLDLEGEGEKIPFALHILAEHLHEHEKDCENPSCDMIMTEELQAVLKDSPKPYQISPQNLFHLDTLFTPIVNNQLIRTYDNIIHSMEVKRVTKKVNSDNIKQVLEDLGRALGMNEEDMNLDEDFDPNLPPKRDDDE